jgi:Calcineurin-like phosphoesterase
LPAPVFAVGDVHGHRDALASILRDAGLLDGHERWSGGDAVVWLVGDLVDRGPDGIGAIDLVRRLEAESRGRVRCLLGNHEALLLAVHRFGDVPTSYAGTFRDVWRANGGVESDLRALRPEHVEWILARPAVAREGGALLLHADSTAYLGLGATPADVSAGISSRLARGSVEDVEDVLDAVSDRGRLADPAAVDALLGRFGGTRIVHGHTPIASVRGVDPREVTGPLVYADGRVTNVDHCLFGGGPGFAVRLDGGQERPDAGRS